MGKENRREKAQKAHKSNVFCAAGAFSRLFHCIPSRRLARLWTWELEPLVLPFLPPEERPDHGPVYPRPGGGPGPSPALCPGYPENAAPLLPAPPPPAQTPLHPRPRKPHGIPPHRPGLPRGRSRHHHDAAHLLKPATRCAVSASGACRRSWFRTGRAFRHHPRSSSRPRNGAT